MEVEGPITSRGGAEALAALTDRHPDIDAIFFSSDVLAVGAVQECHRRGWKVPDRIAIAGYGDMELVGGALSAADHGAGRPLRHGPARGAASSSRGSRGDDKVPTITSLGFEIVDRESA